MKNWMVRIISLLFAFALLVSTGSAVFAGTGAVLRSTNSATGEKNYNTVDITLDEAVEKAIKKSNSLKKSKESIELAQKNREDAGSQMYYNSASDDTQIIDSSYLSQAVTYAQSSITIAVEQLSAEATKAQMEISVLEMFIAINNAEKALELYETELQLKQQELLIAQTQNSLGLISAASLNDVQAAYDKALTNIEDRKTAIDNAYTDLNDTLGNPSNTRYNLTIEKDLSYTPIENVDIEYYATLKASSNVNVIQAEKNYDLAKLRQNNISSSDASNYEELKINANQASRSVAEAKDALKQKLGQSYDEIKTLERSIAANESDLALQEEQYQIKLVQYENGSITEKDLKTAEYTMRSLEESIRTQKLNHYIKVQNFNNPELL